MPQERFEKENDYTLSHVRETSSRDDNVRLKSSLKRTFNFLAAQVITTTQEVVYEPAGYESGGSAAIATTTTIQNFNDVQFSDEIKLMHAKLIEMDGHPPSLEEIFPEPLKKPRFDPAIFGQG